MVQQTKQPIQPETQPIGASPVLQTAQQNQQTQTPTQPTQTTQPGAPIGTPPSVQPGTGPVKKKSKWKLWLIIGIVILIVLALAGYFVFG